MAAVAVLVVTDSDGTISDLNSRLASTSQNDKHTMISLLENYLAALKSGARLGTFQLTTRDTAPSISTSGTGSAQYTF